MTTMCLKIQNVLAFSRFRKALSALLLLAAVSLGSGCAVHWVYDQLDWLIPWYVRDYLDLNSDQKKWLKTRVGEHLDWHRRTQLPLYASLLEEMAQLVERNSLRIEDAERITQQINQLSQTIIEAAAPDVIKLFQEANEKQLAKLFDKIERDNKEFKKTYVDIAKERQNELELEQMTSLLKKWLGGLNSEQKEILNNWAQKWQPLQADLYNEQVRWQAEFRECLGVRQSASFDNCMKKLLTGGEDFYSAAYRQKYHYNLSLTNQLWLDISKSLNPKQRKRAVEQLRDIVAECKELAVESRSK